MSTSSSPQKQRGGFGLGFVVGLLVGLVVALGVALYVTKAPVPFVDKVPQRPAIDEKAEAEKNKNWDPNAGLASKVPRPNTPAEGGEDTTAPAPGSSAGTATGAVPGAAGGTTPAPVLDAKPSPVTAADKVAPIVEKLPAQSDTKAPGSAKAGPDPLVYFIQAGAFQRADEAEAQRAKLAMLGLEARVVDREQSGRMVHRVRLGPFDKIKDAEALRDKLNAQNIEAALVRVERSTSP